MANVVYNYPKTSCDCASCGKMCCGCQTGGLPQCGPPTNMSVRGHDFKPWDYHNLIQFDKERVPTDKSGYHIINPQAYLDKFAPNFDKIECPESRVCKTVYASHDPRLFDAARAIYTTLDTPPMRSSEKLDTINTNKALDGYGQNYQTYSDIKEGQVTYYTSNALEDPFFSPNFVIPSEVSGYVFKDPMDAMKPLYNRQPLNPPDHLKTKGAKYDGCLSFISDSMEHREDIMSRQMYKRNEQRWSPRWT